MFRQALTFAAVVSTTVAVLSTGLASTIDVTVRPSAVALGVNASDSRTNAPTARSVPLFPAASDLLRQGFVRAINHPDQAGEVAAIAIDDAGWRSPENRLTIDANETLHFNSNDLEQGNCDNGLSGGTGAPGKGDWRLELTSDLDIEVLAYIRTGDGFLTAIHDVVEQGLIGSRVAIFNPGRSKNQVSLM